MIPPTQQLMPGMQFSSKAGQNVTLSIESIDVLRNALGVPLTNAFVRCFAALDRLMSIFDAIHLNNEHAPAGSVRHERNMHTLFVFAAGLVYEFAEGLQQLRAADVEGHLGRAGRERWARLAAFADPKHRDVLSQIRNNMAFHLGDPDVVERGVERLRGIEDPTDRTPQVVISSDDGASLLQVRHDLGLAVILAGIKVRPWDVPAGTPNGRRWITEEDIKLALDEAVAGHFAIAGLFDEMFFDALREAGADLSAAPPLPSPGTDERITPPSSAVARSAEDPPAS